MRYMLLLYDNDDTREAFISPGSEGLGAEVDAVQEALLAAAVQRPAGGVPESPRAWLVTVAARAAAAAAVRRTAPPG